MIRMKKIHSLKTDNKDHSVSAKTAAQDERQTLLDQIILLKTYVSVLQHNLETPKFGQLQLQSKPLLHNSKVAPRCNVSNVQTALRYDLYRFSGIRCTRIQSTGRFVFEITGTNDLYAVEILLDNDDRGKLGRWILPMSVDVKTILSQYPLNNLNNVMHFLKSCKHHVECHVCRVKQLEELRDCLAEVKNARVTHTVEIAYVELTMSGVKDLKNDEVHNVRLCLCYRSTEVRPYKLLSDTDDNEKPSADLLKRLNIHFKPFLRTDLSSAFQQVNKSQAVFLWKPVATVEDEDNSIILDESSEDSGFLSIYLHRDGKKQEKNKEASKKRSKKNKEQNKSKKRKKSEEVSKQESKKDREQGENEEQKKSKEVIKQKSKQNKEQNDSSATYDNEAENSLRVEVNECADGIALNFKVDKKRDGFSNNSEENKSLRYKQPAKTARKSSGVQESLGDLWKSETEVSDVEKRNDQYAAGRSNKPKSKVTSAANRTQRRAKSKKHQADVKNAQVQDNNVLSKADNNQVDEGNSPKNAGSKRRRIRNQKLLQKSNDSDCEDTKSPQSTRKRSEKTTRVNKKDIEDYTILNSKRNREMRANVSNSTPIAKKLPDKRKFFDASRISRISKEN